MRDLFKLTFCMGNYFVTLFCYIIVFTVISIVCAGVGCGVNHLVFRAATTHADQLSNHVSDLY